MTDAAIRRTLLGIVVASNSDKTVRVRIERRVKHPLYGKVMTKRRNLLAHDEENKCHTGYHVVLEECKPISKRKSWKVARITKEYSK